MGYYIFIYYEFRFKNYLFVNKIVLCSFLNRGTYLRYFRISIVNISKYEYDITCMNQALLRP